EARPHFPTSSSARMVAGTSGATPGSAAGVDELRLGRLMLPHPPRATVSDAITEKLAIVRAYPKLAMAFPRITFGRTRHTANRKTAVGATTTQPLLCGFGGRHHPITASRRP